MPGAGSDLGGRGAGGQPQRQRGMPKVVGAACRLGTCPVFRDGCGAGLVPDPAVEAFADRAAAGTPEQPPIFGASEGPQVPAQVAGKLRGDRDRPDGAAVVGDRRLLLADEPSGALDSVNAAEVMRLLHEACQRGVAAVVVTHDAQLAAWADRIALLRDGRVTGTTTRPPGPESLLMPGEIR